MHLVRRFFDFNICIWHAAATEVSTVVVVVGGGGVGGGGTNRKTSVDRIATLFAGNGLSDSSAVMSVDPDGSTLSVSSDGVKVAAQGITEAELHTSVAGGGLVGGNNTPLAVGAGTGVTVNANDIAIGQDVATNANVTFADIRATGNLTVEGTTVNAQVANLNVEDRFVLLNSGSAAGDGGIVVGCGVVVGGGGVGGGGVVLVLVLVLLVRVLVVIALVLLLLVLVVKILLLFSDQ